jgi:AraC-like DNA-binding protein
LASSTLLTLTTTDLETCAAAVEAIRGRGWRFAPHGRAGDFSIALQSAAFGDLRLTRWTGSGLAVTLRGRQSTISLVFGGDVAYRPDLAAGGRPAGRFIRPGEATTALVGDASGLCLCIPGPTLVERAERLSGRACGPSIFDDAAVAIDMDGPLGAVLADTAQNALNERVSLDKAGLGFLATGGGYEDLLLNLATCAVFPKIAMEAGHTPLDCGPATISGIRDFLRAHACEAIELALVASRFGMSLRAMQENFRRYYAYSPRDYLIECRLEEARRMLRTAPRGQTVSTIALCCGFSDHKAFSARYRARFLESPSATLRAAAR